MLIPEKLPVNILDREFSFELLEEFIVHLDSRRFVRVPKGFITDLASIPRFFWRIIPPVGKYNKAAVIHDFLYRGGTIEYVVGNNHRLPTRRETDRIFKNIMQQLKVPAWKREVMFSAVRMAGWTGWKKNK